MAITYKVLGQVAPSAITETTLYTVPASTTAVVSTFVACNRGAAATFRISVSATGAATANKDYLYYNVALPANSTFTATIGATLPAGAIVRVYASTADTSFSAFGSEHT